MRLIVSALVSMVVLGCDHEDFVEPLPDVVELTLAEDGTELVSFREVVDNGVVANGFGWNGFRWNGFRWNGFRWNGFRWNGVTLNASSVSDVAYDSASGSLSAKDGGNQTVGLEELDELLAEGDHEAAGVTTLSEVKISEIEQVAVGSQSFQFQRVQTRTRSNGTAPWSSWQDACLDGGGNPTKAILLKGDWSSPQYDRITGTEADQATTWACRGAALAKCVEWGYHPERTYSGTPLANHHQACTRLVRADYCGSGEHHTENGTLIDVADSLGIQTHDTNWQIEAAWGPQGALCFNAPRKTYWSRSAALGSCSSLPSCDANANSNLGDDVSHWMGQGALFVTRSTPTALSTAEPAPADSGG